MSAVLIVDDDATGRRVAVFNLRKAGFEVDEAADGEAALAVFDPSRHGAVVTDLKMPKLDGMRLMAALLARARERHAQTERALRPPPPPPDDVATQDVAEESEGPSGPSSFGIPSSRLGWLYVFGPLTLYALLGFAGYGAAVALLGSAALEAFNTLVEAL